MSAQTIALSENASPCRRCSHVCGVGSGEAPLTWQGGKILPGDLVALEVFDSPCVNFAYLTVRQDERGLYVEASCGLPRAYLNTQSGEWQSSLHRGRIIGVLKGAYLSF